ncbi:MAG TPA: glutathione S-transferase family protein [Noviherbaspirillum sp.]|jgi:glutathione S-transferase|uniref:glutathione S-transferase family protein n=1 Tax=Noviherbaspirillum sp. TaxID=1926288 RepID=UPI002F92C2C1
MSALILHHYPNSPFSEKIRLILGYKRLEWVSVTIPVIMPKPDLTALTGGYRRTPVLQVGADIYCDTALIADQLERMAPAPSLYPPALEGQARTLAQWADATLFWTVIAYVFQPAAVPYLLGGVSPEQMKAFSADRAAMRGNAPRMSAAEGTAALREYLRRLDAMLESGSGWLLGSEPTIADFSIYHCIWFVQLATPLAAILDDYPRLLAWAAKMRAFGHHESRAMRGEEAVAVARDATPASTEGLPFIDFHGIARDERVSVTPTDYALDPVEGELVAGTASALAVRRNDPRAGDVHVHFPRIGFQMKRL